MAKENLQEMSQEELIAKEKQLKMATGALAGLLIVLLFTAIFITFQQKFSIFSVIPFTFLPILAINFNLLKAIKKELADREKVD